MLKKLCLLFLFHINLQTVVFLRFCNSTEVKKGKRCYNKSDIQEEKKRGFESKLGDWGKFKAKIKAVTYIRTIQHQLRIFLSYGTW